MVLRQDGSVLAGLTYSVVVPTSGVRDSLRDCVEALRVQTFPSNEVIVVGALPMRRPVWFDRNVRFVTARASSNGQRNAGTCLATGDIVLFVDDDVILDGDFAERLLGVWASSAGPIAGAAGVIENDPQLPRPVSVIYYLLGLGYTAFRARASGLRWSGHVRSVYQPVCGATAGFLHGTCVAYDRLLALSEPFDETFDSYVMGGDLDMAARLGRRGRLVQVPDARCRVADVPTTGPQDPYLLGLWHGERLAYYRWRHRGPGPLGTICWGWANLGQLAVLTFRGVRTGSWSAFRGYRDGLRRTYSRIASGRCRRWPGRLAHPPP